MQGDLMRPPKARTHEGGPKDGTSGACWGIEQPPKAGVDGNSKGRE